MNCNKTVYDTIKKLTPEQRIDFSLSCLNRLKHLPKLFINSDTYGINYLNEIIPKDTIESILNGVTEKLSDKPLTINKSDIKNDIEILEKMLLDDDIEIGVEKQIFFYYIVIIIHILEYISTGDCKYIELCSDAAVEIINQTKGHEFTENNPLWTGEEFYENLDAAIDKEIEKEIEIIEIIKTGNKKILGEYIRNNRIEYNVLRKDNPMSAINQEKLYRQNYDALSKSERADVLRSVAEADPRFTLLRFERFERFGVATETAVFICDGKEFVFVPGDTVTLGWDSFTEGPDERTSSAMLQSLEEFEITDIAGFIDESTSPVRQVTVAPMLVEREVGVIGWREVATDSPELIPLKSEIEQNRKYITPGRRFEIHNTLRVSHIDGRQVWEVYNPISLRELIENTHASGFSLPTEDEWEYLCACGKRTLFRWGDSFDFDMKLLYFSDSDEPGYSPYSLKLPNGFGLFIAYDPYMQEVAEDSEYFLKGGDGGCNICGGSGMVLGYFPVSAFFRAASLSDDDLDCQSDIGGDYTFYRRIVRLA